MRRGGQADNEPPYRATSACREGGSRRTGVQVTRRRKVKALKLDLYPAALSPSLPAGDNLCLLCAAVHSRLRAVAGPRIAPCAKAEAGSAARPPVRQSALRARLRQTVGLLLRRQSPATAGLVSPAQSASRAPSRAKAVACPMAELSDRQWRSESCLRVSLPARVWDSNETATGGWLRDARTVLPNAFIYNILAFSATGNSRCPVPVPAGTARTFWKLC